MKFWIGVVGLLIVATVIGAALFAGQLTPFDPDANDFSNQLAPPSKEYWLGTDQFGRDLFTRMVYGARTAIFIGILSSLLAGVTGLVLGVTSVYAGGTLDRLFQRAIDLLSAIPLVILVAVFLLIFGNDIKGIVAAITLPFIPRCARVVRLNALASIKVHALDGSVSMLRRFRNLFRSSASNTLAPLLVVLIAYVGYAILIEGLLTVFGVGIQEPVPAWGLMVQGSAEEFTETSPGFALFPPMSIVLAAFGFSLCGDLLRRLFESKSAND